MYGEVFRSATGIRQIGGQLELVAAATKCWICCSRTPLRPILLSSERAIMTGEANYTGFSRSALLRAQALGIAWDSYRINQGTYSVRRS